ncbi:hypothetical protein CPC698_0087B, partial [Chlamydia psittaci C6/98]
VAMFKDKIHCSLSIFSKLPDTSMVLEKSSSSPDSRILAGLKE